MVNIYRSPIGKHHLFMFAYVDISGPIYTYVVLCPSHPVWPDLAKFDHLDKILQVVGKFLTVYFLFGKILNLFWQHCSIVRQIFIVANGPILKHNLPIWTHCPHPTVGQSYPNIFHLSSKIFSMTLRSLSSYLHQSIVHGRQKARSVYSLSLSLSLYLSLLCTVVSREWNHPKPRPENTDLLC